MANTRVQTQWANSTRRMRRWWIRSTRGVEDFAVCVEDHIDPRHTVYFNIDHAPFQKWVVFVAGLGFFIDAYNTFALSIIQPMVAFVYWNDTGIPDRSARTALLCASLVGTFFGQLTFGFLGDLFGRRKMYGIELLIITTGTIGCAMASTGANESMSIVGLLVWWRFLMGIGIGADYPLSAVIASEFAPRKHRARMLVSVFWMQSLGQLLAILVSLAVVRISGVYAPDIEDVNACKMLLHPSHAVDPDCVRVVDRAWRWIVGLGAVPALFAVFFRLTIPESSRFTMDVGGDQRRAALAAQHYFSPNPSQRELSLQVQEPGEISEGSGRNRLPTSSNSQSPRPSVGILPTEHPPQPANKLDPTIPGQAYVHNAGDSEGYQVSIKEADPPVPKTVLETYFEGWYDYFLTQGNWRYILGASLAWFLVDIPFYGLLLSVSPIGGSIWPVAPPASVYSFFMSSAYHELVIISIGSVLGSALLVKLVNHVSPRTVQFWGFLSLALLFLVTGATFKRLKSLAGEADGAGASALTVLYVLTTVAFSLGPNGTTYLLPAMLFPTKWRCTCHGIAAASGKFGSILVQLFLAYYTFEGCTVYHDGSRCDKSHSTNPEVGNVLLVLFAFMLCGAAVTWWMLPETRDNGEMLSLEDLAKGKQHIRRRRPLPQ